MDSKDYLIPIERRSTRGLSIYFEHDQDREILTGFRPVRDLCLTTLTASLSDGERRRVSRKAFYTLAPQYIYPVCVIDV